MIVANINKFLLWYFNWIVNVFEPKNQSTLKPNCTKTFTRTHRRHFSTTAIKISRLNIFGDATLSKQIVWCMVNRIWKGWMREREREINVCMAGVEKWQQVVWDIERNIAMLKFVWSCLHKHILLHWTL